MQTQNVPARHLCYPVLVLFLALLLLVSPVRAADLNLYVQPISSVTETERAFKPLADYLSAKIGYKVNIKTEANFLTYWERMRRGNEFDLVLDAAHFTDYRDSQQGYEVLAKVPDTVSFSLVTSGKLVLFDASELIGKTVMSAPSPSLGGVRMAEIYANPLRQPQLLQADNFEQALDMLHKGQIQAALVPTPLVNGDTSVNTVMTTQPVPHMAFSASPRVDATTKQAIRQALLNADKDKQGQVMLKKMQYARFQPANNAMYAGYADLLEGIWGYKSSDTTASSQ
jgi:ABC-type phosphate/phosphonate transport system substrate-binding protein